MKQNCAKIQDLFLYFIIFEHFITCTPVIMYTLVRFLCDGIFSVNKENEVKYGNKKIKGRYGRCWYEAEIVCKHRK